MATKVFVLGVLLSSIFSSLSHGQSPPRVFVGSAFNLEQLINRSLFNYTSSAAGFHNHPVGWRALNASQRAAVMASFVNKQVGMETDICCAHNEVSYVDEMRQYIRDINVVYVSNNIDTKTYEGGMHSPVTEEGITYPNSGEMYSNMTRLYENHNAPMMSLFTVWNAINNVTNLWMQPPYW